MSGTKHPAGHLLQAYHDGELDSLASAEIKDHCLHCRLCQSELTQLARMGQIFASVPDPELPRTVWPRVKPDHTVQSRFRIPLTIAACAAGMAVGVLLGPIQLSVETTDSNSQWSESATLWNGGTTSSLFSVYQSGQE